jgi:hypothetical protein
MMCVAGFVSGLALCLCSFVNQTCQDRLADVYIESIATNVVVSVEQIRPNTVLGPLGNNWMATSRVAGRVMGINNMSGSRRGR